MRLYFQKTPLQLAFNQLHDLARSFEKSTLISNKIKLDGFEFLKIKTIPLNVMNNHIIDFDSLSKEIAKLDYKDIQSFLLHIKKTIRWNF